MTASSDSIRWLVVRWPSNKSWFWLMISCRAVSDLVRFFPVLGLLFVELNLGRVSSPELVQLLVKAGSREQPAREQHPDGKDAKRGKPYGLPV